MYTYGMYTYGMYTYGMYTYGMYTYGMYQRQFGCGNLKMVGLKKQDFCNVVTRFQGFRLIF